MSDETLDELRPRLIAAMIPHVAFDGWSTASLLAGAQDAGIDADVARLAFPGGAAQMVESFTARADARLVESLDAQNIMAMKVRERIRRAVATRLEQAEGEREAVRRTLSVLAMPQNLRLAAKTLWRTADTMWRAAGDTATDYNHYTKRGILFAVYAATIAAFLDDESEGWADTRAFLQRRIDGIMRFEKAKAGFLARTQNLPSLSRFVGRLRYPVV